MDGLPKNIDLSCLTGRIIEEVRISRFQLGLIFDDNEPRISISIESDIVLTDPAGKEAAIENFRANGGILCLLVGKKVSHATRSPQGGLELAMTDATRIELVIKHANYEAFQLHIDDQTFVA